MASKQQLLCLWSGPAFVVAFAAGLVLAGMLPPPSPLLPADTVAAFFRDNGDLIRFGQMILILGSGLLLFFTALITTQMRKIPGCAPEIIYTQLCAGCIDSVLFIVPALIWLVATFRPERDPQITFLLNDMGWITLVTPVTLAVVQNLTIGIGILSDTGPRPIFPRWIGIYNIVSALWFMPGIVVAYFKSGPFAWGGIFPFWIPAVEFCVWFIIMFMGLRDALERE